MKREVKLFFWVTNLTEYTVQICYETSLQKKISLAFKEWSHVGKGLDTEKQQAISLYKKEYRNKTEMENDLLIKQEQLNLKFSMEEVV